MMFHSRGNEVATGRLSQARRAENSEVDAFRSAAREDDLTRFAAQDGCGAITRVIKNGASLGAYMVNTRWISPNIAKKRKHRLAHRGIKRGCRIVIEVNGPHVHEEKPDGGLFGVEKRSSFHGSAVFE